MYTSIVTRYLTENLSIHVEYISSSIARLYATGSMYSQDEVPIPRDLKVYDVSNNINIKLFKNNFILNLFCNYEIIYNENTVLKLANSKWDIDCC